MQLVISSRGLRSGDRCESRVAGVPPLGCRKPHGNPRDPNWHDVGDIRSQESPSSEVAPLGRTVVADNSGPTGSLGCVGTSLQQNGP
ncbi:hypothetical protein DL764_006011 [Monosporascus ibericus]|uniref:Uncharacterized protein n=1 Tax=Monosporascus ibericus TaxID=155417 RepID=A0A4Q4T6J7_9PEZI|nr:hypothetical protein DL764_006011 [Monosporascus ibericus]